MYANIVLYYPGEDGRSAAGGREGRGADGAVAAGRMI